MAQDQPADRLRTIHVADGEFEVHPDVLAQEMADLGVVLRMIGGSVTIQAVRQELEAGSDHYATVAVRWRWKSGGPAHRRPVPQPEPEDFEDDEALEPEPVAAG